MTQIDEYLPFVAAWSEEQLAGLSESLSGFHASTVAAVKDLASNFGISLPDSMVLIAIYGGIAMLLLVTLRIVRQLRGADSKASLDRLASLTRGPKLLGFAAVGVFALVLGYWSAAAPLASAAIAPGVISPDGQRKTVQHLEGGIIRKIHVREGEVVAEGEPLISLDDTSARSFDAEVRERFLHLLATEARLEAERINSSAINFPQSLLQDGAGLFDYVMEGQRELFNSRRASLSGRTKILEARVMQLDEQNAGVNQVISAQEDQLVLIDEEIATSKMLLSQGLERKSRTLALLRARADIVGARASNRAKIAENAQIIGETQLQLLAIQEERREEIARELADMRRILAELKGQLPSREDILKRTVIRAPITGTVMNLRTTTLGGVIGPGEPLLDIVPTDGPLIIDARVRPTDIERIAPGMSARVVLTAYKQRSMPLVHGRLRSISADAFTDERTGMAYFLAKVEVVEEDLAALKQVRLSPGMPAEVMLLDGERSLLGYLVAPLVESQRRSFREN